jgi:YD repeat-containing protein
LTGLSRSNGVNSTLGYDNAGRLTTINHAGPSGNLLFTNYTVDPNGNRIAMESNGGLESYTLDALNRLTNVSYPNGDTAAYSYDANSNRLTATANDTAGLPYELGLKPLANSEKPPQRLGAVSQPLRRLLVVRAGFESRCKVGQQYHRVTR